MIFDHTLDHVSAEDWTTLDVRVLLARNTGTAPPAGAATVADCFTGGLVELSDTSYVRKTLSGLSVVSSDADRACDANSVTWSSLGGTQLVSGALVYIDVTTDADHIPVGWFPRSTAIATTGGNFTLAWASAGLFVFEEA